MNDATLNQIISTLREAVERGNLRTCDFLAEVEMCVGTSTFKRNLAYITSKVPA